MYKFSGGTAETLRETLRYGIVSGVALGVDVGLLTLLVEVFAWNYLIAGAIAFLAGMLLAYLLSITWVFTYRSSSSPQSELLIFALIGVNGLVLNEAVLWVGTSVMGAHYLLSKAFAAVASFSSNFVLRKWLLFSRKVPTCGD